MAYLGGIGSDANEEPVSVDLLRVSQFGDFVRGGGTVASQVIGNATTGRTAGSVDHGTGDVAERVASYRQVRHRDDGSGSQVNAGVAGLCARTGLSGLFARERDCERIR